MAPADKPQQGPQGPAIPSIGNNPSGGSPTPPAESQAPTPPAPAKPVNPQPPPVAKPPAASANGPQRTYAEEGFAVDHDLFRLKDAYTYKDLSMGGVQKIYQPVLHHHFFHSVDSKGLQRQTSEFSNGHFHKVVVEWKDGRVVNATCGPPLTKVQVLGPNNTYIFKTAPFLEPDPKQENRKVTGYHIHQVEYVQSNKLKLTSRPKPENIDAQEEGEGDVIIGGPTQPVEPKV